MDNETSNCLDVIQEECAEVIKVISKIKRFGFDSHHPGKECIQNINLLAEELGDLYGAVDKFMQLQKDVCIERNFNVSLSSHRAAKPERIDKYYEYTKRIN